MQERFLFQKIRASLRRLQRADDATKRRWFLGASTISIVAICAVWLVYVGMSIAPAKTVAADTSSSFSNTFKIGIDGITKDIGEKYNVFKKNIDDKLNFIEQKVNETNTIEIEGPDTVPFIPKKLENVPEIPLP